MVIASLEILIKVHTKMRMSVLLLQIEKDQKIESLQLENASLTSKLKEFETSSSAAEERTKSLESSITHLSSYLNEQTYTLKSHLEEIKKIQSTMDSYLRQSRT